jgi:hypothetical protein
LLGREGSGQRLSPLRRVLLQSVETVPFQSKLSESHPRESYL